MADVVIQPDNLKLKFKAKFNFKKPEATNKKKGKK